MQPKTKSIAETDTVLLRVTWENRVALERFERELMKRYGITDCCKIPNSEVVNYAIRKAGEV